MGDVLAAFVLCVTAAAFFFAGRQIGRLEGTGAILGGEEKRDAFLRRVLNIKDPTDV